MNLEQQRRLVCAMLDQARDEDGNELSEDAKVFILQNGWRAGKPLRREILKLREMENDELAETRGLYPKQ